MRGVVGFLGAIVLAVSEAVPTIPIGDTSYVVRLHAALPESLDYLQQSGDGKSDGESPQFYGDIMPMTASNGKRYTCYVPDPPNLKAVEEPKSKRTFLEVGREAISKLKPNCLPTNEPKLNGLYDICHGKSVSITEKDESGSLRETKSILGTFQKDTRQLGFVDYQYRNAEQYPEDNKVAAELIKGAMLYTQHYGTSEDSIEVIVQYTCWDTPVTSLIGRRTPNLASPSKEDHAISFLFGSRWFCLDLEAESVNDVHVKPFLLPSFGENECIRRTEGWWTYEFCFRDHVDQYHREQNGELTAVFSLGKYDMNGNAAALRKKKSIVSEFLDDTNDKPQPAFEEIYEGGTACDEVGRTRWTRVLMFCPTIKKQAPYIISIQESATCSYLLKIAVPSLCDHPYFAKEERLRSELLSQTIHCIAGNDELESQEIVTTKLTSKSQMNEEL